MHKALSDKELKKIVYDSREFNERLEKYDLHDPAQVQEACRGRGYQLPMGFHIGMAIADRLEDERKKANEQAKGPQEQKNQAKKTKAI